MPGRAARRAPPAGRSLRGSDYFGRLLDKTRLCKFFDQGKCSRGTRCTFAHGVSELHAQPDFFCSQLCMEFMQTGGCRYGTACRFAHGVEQLRPTARGLAPPAAAAAAMFRDPAAAVAVAGVPGDDGADGAGSGGEGGQLRHQLEVMRQQTLTIEAQIHALEYVGPAPVGQPLAAAWPAAVLVAPAAPLTPLSMASTDEGSRQGLDDALGLPLVWPGIVDARGLMGHGSGWPNAAGAGPAEPPKTTLQPTVYKDGGAPSPPHPPNVVVKNTFIEFERSAPVRRQRRRALSAPGHAPWPDSAVFVADAAATP